MNSLYPPFLPLPAPSRRKVFVSYHHQKDQHYANLLRFVYSMSDTFIDRSLPKELASDDDDYILSIIRTQHLKTSTITIVLIGEETWSRKWVDWEIYSSLRPYKLRTVNGLLGIILPSATYLPPRFALNYSETKLGNGTIQTGYARLINWGLIAPPPLPSFMNPIEKLSYHQILNERKKTLKTWIDMAFLNRSKTNLINNTMDRFKDNLI
ncbi:MAG: TIR domain-containing protein [Bacillota bacterium]